jgi:hypothetical protein
MLKQTYHFARIALSALATTSVIFGAFLSQKSSKDLQWSGAHLLAEHINPFETFMSGDLQHRIILTQAPNYLHLLYFTLLPFGTISFDKVKLYWLIINLLVCGIIFFHIHKTTNSKIFTAIILLFLCSSPFRACLANGQTTLIIMLCFIISIKQKNNAFAGSALALAICKYSFAPALFLLSLAQKKWKALILAFAIHAITIYVFCSMFDLSFIYASILPLMVSAKAVALGNADFMSLLEINYGKNVLYYTFPITFCVLSSITYFNTTHRNPSNDIAFVSVMSLLCFKHLTYDFLFLVFALIFAATHGIKKNVMVIATVVWFWFLFGAIEKWTPFGKHYNLLITLNVILLCITLGSIWLQTLKYKQTSIQHAKFYSRES